MKCEASRSVTLMTVTRVVADERDAERVALERVDADVARAHPLDDVFHDADLALALVQVEVLDDALEARAAQNLLADRLETVLDSRRHGRPHVGFGHLLGHDEDDGLRTISVRQIVRDDHCRERDDHKRKHDRPLAARGDHDEILRCVRLTW